PLVVDVARPSAALGWRNQETLSFGSRAAGGFDAVFMLALLHHLLVSERLPLDEVIDTAAAWTRDLLLVEWVDPTDRHFEAIARGRMDLFKGLTAQALVDSAARQFTIVRAARLPNSRELFLFRKM